MTWSAAASLYHQHDLTPGNGRPAPTNSGFSHASRFLLVVILLSTVFGCSSVPVSGEPQPPNTTGPENVNADDPDVSCVFPSEQPSTWAQEAVGYEVFVRSFNDSDGDGIGDTAYVMNWTLINIMLSLE